MKSNYSILVNTTDKFEDCWLPFFTLFSKYWPDYKGKIYLNTEYKEFKYPGLDIVSVQNCKNTNDADKITWSECLLRAINIIDTDLILYMQEDYFLKAPVKNDMVNQYVSRVKKHDIDCLHLTDQNSFGPFSPSEFDDLWILDQQALDRVSCQAAIWKKNILLSYVKTWESPWQFETNGTKRSHYLNHKIYSVNRDIYKLNVNEIIPYVFTGIIQGKWYQEVVPLFEKNNIEVDFSRRGFITPGQPKTLAQRIKKRIVNLPTEAISAFDLLKLKLKTPKKK